MSTYTKPTALERINALPNKDKRTILKSKKDFIIFDLEGRYTLTNDLFRHRHAYQWGGSVGRHALCGARTAGEYCDPRV